MKQWIAQTGAKSAAVVGGGFIGLEMAENLVHLGLDTCVVEFAPQVGGVYVGVGRPCVGGVWVRGCAGRQSAVRVWSQGCAVHFWIIGEPRHAVLRCTAHKSCSRLTPK